MRGKKAGSLANIHFVVVEPKGDGNIGSIVRIIDNFGFGDLVLVNPVPFLTVDGYRMAASSKDLLDSVVICSTLEEAVGDSNLVVATTGKYGKLKKPIYAPWEVAEMSLRVAERGKVSIVFGREDRGLENVELRCSHILSRIPTSGSNPSLNLSHAVCVYAYEISRLHATDRDYRRKERVFPAPFEELEGFYRHLRRLLERVGYLDPQNPERIMDVLRRFFGRCLPTSREVRVLRGILRKIEWALGFKGGCSEEA